MPINIASRRNKTKTVTVTYDNETCDVVYRPSAITPRFSREFMHAAGDEDHDRLTTAIERAVISWDVLDEHGQPVPPTAENTADFESPFLGAVITAIFQDMAPSPTTGGGSFSG